MIYIFLIGFITLFAVLFRNLTNEYGKKRFLVLSFGIIGFLIAFRGISTGADTWNYYSSFLRDASMNISNVTSDDVEIGYLILVKILAMISSNPQILFIFEGILVAFSYGVFIYCNTETITEAYVAVLGYLAFNLFSFQLSGVRQSLAMCICIWGFEFIKKKKIIPFLLVVILGSGIHASALLFIPAYFIALFRTTWKVKVSVFLLGIVAVINTNLIIQWTYNLSERFSKYGIEETGNGYIFFAIMVLVLVISEITMGCLVSQKENTGESPQELFNWYNINYLCFILWCMRLITRTAERPSLYYIPATIILISRFYKGFNANSKKIFVFLITVALILLFLYRIRTVTYSFCW